MPTFVIKSDINFQGRSKYSKISRYIFLKNALITFISYNVIRIKYINYVSHILR